MAMELRIPTSEQLKSVYEGQLKQAFPASELKPLQSIEELWRDGLYRPWCLLTAMRIVVPVFCGWGGRAGPAGLPVRLRGSSKQGDRGAAPVHAAGTGAGSDYFRGKRASLPRSRSRNGGASPGFYARKAQKPPGMRPLYSGCPTRRSTGPKSRWTTAC